MLKAIVNSPVRSGNQTIVNGDLVIGTSGEGVNFTANTPAAGMTSQLLNWYEEGTWTPVLSDGTNNATMAYAAAAYTRVGNLVTVWAWIETSSLGSVTGNIIQGVAAKGVNFTANTPAAGMTSQLLNWYEEGTWTPVISTTGTAPTISSYSKFLY